MRRSCLFVILAVLVLVGLQRVYAVGLVTSLQLNETSGNTASNSVSGATDGTLTNFTGVDPNKWVPGRTGNALKFDGTDDYVEFGEPVSCNASYTVAFWVKAPAQSYEHCLFYEYNPNDYRPTLTCRGQWGAIQFFSNDNAGSNLFSIITTATVLDDSWHHVALVDDAGDVKLYVDGILDVTASYTPVSVNRPSARLGARKPTPDDFFAGTFDDVRGYDMALTAAEVRELALCTGAGDESVCLHLDNTTGDLTYEAVTAETDIALSNFSAVDDEKWVAGKVNNALEFDGVNDYVDIDVPVTTNGAYSISFWVKGPSQNHEHTVYTEFDSSDWRPAFVFRPQSGPIQVYSKDDNGNTLFSINSTMTIFDDTWHHVALTDSGSTAMLYVDGVQDGTANYTSATFTRNRSRLGAKSTTPQMFYDGAIDEFHAFTKVLSAVEIQQLAFRTMNIAILRDSSITGLDLNLVDTVSTALEADGHVVDALTANHLADAGYLNDKAYDMVVLTYSPGFPLAAQTSFIDFLSNGGDAVFMGGAFPTLDVPQAQVGLNIFSDYEPYALSGVTDIVVHADQDYLAGGLDMVGSFTGRWVVPPAFPNISTYVPLLAAQDGYDRNRGWAAGLLINYGSSAFQHSHWLIYGVDNISFYNDTDTLTSLLDMVYVMAGGTLSSEAAAANTALLAETLPLTTAAPQGIEINDAGTGFVYEDGSPFFMRGANYLGNFGRQGHHTGKFAVEYFEEDFRKASECGINCFRLYGAGALIDDPCRLAALKECARKYEIYLIVCVTDHTTYMTQGDLFDRGEVLGAAFKDEPMLLGYDLQNEPYYWELGHIEDNAGIPLDVTYPYYARPYGVGDYFDWLEPWDTQTDANGNWHGSTFPGITAEHFGGYFKNQTSPAGQLPYNNDYLPVYNDVNGIYGQWISWLSAGIRSEDPNALITVGYNSIYCLWPSNDQLDFLSQHTYRRPFAFADVVENITTLDRITLAWPDKPVTIGEFGYQNNETMLDDSILDLASSGIGEMINYLAVFTNGHAGIKKWRMNEITTAMSRKLNGWIDYADLDAHGEKFGLCYYDGTPQGRIKPTGMALKLFAEYLDNYADLTDPSYRGVLTLTSADTAIDTGYTFESPRALFIGDVAYTAPRRTTTVTIDDFESYADNSELATVWTQENPSVIYAIELDTTTPKVGSKALKFSFDLTQSPNWGKCKANYAVAWDFDQVQKISFWAKGTAAGENFKVAFSTYHAGLGGAYASQTMQVLETTTDWQYVELRVGDFEPAGSIGPVEWFDIEKIALVPVTTGGGATSGAIYIDEFMVEVVPTADTLSEDYESFVDTTALQTVYAAENPSVVYSIDLVTSDSVDQDQCMSFSYDLTQSPNWGKCNRTFAPSLSLSDPYGISFWVRASGSNQKMKVQLTEYVPGQGSYASESDVFSLATDWQFIDLLPTDFSATGDLGGIRWDSIQKIRFVPTQDQGGATSGTVYIDMLEAADKDAPIPLTFTSATPVNVMSTWDDSDMKLVATEDTTVTIAPRTLADWGGIAGNEAITGTHGTVQNNAGLITIDLLQGEIVTIDPNTP